MNLILASCFVFIQSILVNVQCKDEFVSIWTPNKLQSMKYFSIAILGNIEKRTEIGLQFRNFQVTVPFYNDNIEMVKMRPRMMNSKRDFPLNVILYRNDTYGGQKCISETLHSIERDQQMCHIFIQLDQQIYKPGDEIKFRIIVVDRDLKLYQMNSIYVAITDPYNHVVAEYEDLTDMHFRVFSTKYQLTSNSTQGEWKISAYVDKLKDQMVSKTFIVNDKKAQNLQNQLLTVTNQRLSKPDDNVEITVKSSSRLNKVVAFVMTKNGMIDKLQVPCKFLFVCKFSIQILASMAPQAKVVVYHVNDDGSMLKRETTINIEGMSGNFLTLDLPLAAHTNHDITISFETEKNSKVYVMGFRKQLPNIENSNDVTVADVVKKITDNIDSIKHSLINITSWNECTQEDINKIEKSRIRVAQHSGNSYSSNLEDDYNNFNEVKNLESEMKNKYFDDDENNDSTGKWIFDDFKMESNSIDKSYKTPSSPGIYVITAFAVGRHNKLAIAESNEILIDNTRAITKFVV